MKKNIKQYRLWAMLAALLALPVAFTGCSEDDPFEFDDNGKNAINSPSLSEAGKTVSQLTFAWDKVDGATQYAYELRDPLDELVSGNVTTETTATFTGLKDNTTYTLNVWAYTALNSDKKGSPVVSLKATTDKIVPLDTPELTAGKGNGGVLISWTAIENAARYDYIVYDVDGNKKKEGSVTDSQVLIGGLAVGTYTIEVTAISELEAYYDSEAATLTFDRERIEMWRRTGTYESATDGNFTADIVSYDDGSYSIEAPYGEAGYAINFSVDPETAAITILNSNYDSDGYISYWVSSNRWLWSYTGGGYSAFSGDQSSGEVWFFTYCYDAANTLLGSGDYDTFHWEGIAADTWSATGTFLEDAYPDYPWNATIYANGGGSYTIKTWYTVEGFDMNFTVDNAGNVTFATEQSDDAYWYLPGSDDYWAYILKPGKYYDPEFTGDINGGSLKYYDGYDGWVTFTWGTGTAIVTGPTIDDLVGTYNESFTGYDYIYYAGDPTTYWYTYNDNTVTISKVDDNTISLSGFYWIEETLTGTVDMEAKTITFAAGQTIAQWYTLGSGDSVSGDVVATFDENFTITFSDWSGWYGGDKYIYYSTTTLTKQ